MEVVFLQGVSFRKRARGTRNVCRKGEGRLWTLSYPITCETSTSKSTAAS